MLNTQRRSPGLGLYLLLYHIIANVGLNYIPPATLMTVASMVAIYMHIIKLPWSGLEDVCISYDYVFSQGDWKRLIFGALEHADDFHLYYNMVSFILKGQQLEKHFGAPKFVYILSVFTALTSLTMVGLCHFAGEFIDYRFNHQCAVGFSGVIFALKVLTTYYYYPNASNRILGIPVMIPAKWVVWVELLLIQMVTPNASLFGHLAGILVGLAYVKGPLKFIMHDAVSFLSSLFPVFNNSGHRSNGGRTTGYCDSFPRGMSEEEQIRRATEASLRENYHHRPTSTSRTYAHIPNGNYMPYSSQPSSSNAVLSPAYKRFYPVGLSEEQQIEQATEASLRENFSSRTPPSAPLDNTEFQYSGELRPPAPGFYPLPADLNPNLNTIRSRRVQHFAFS